MPKWEIANINNYCSSINGFFALVGLLREFPVAIYTGYASTQTLVQPCPTQKIHISELYALDYHYLIVAGHDLGKVM